MTYPWEDPARLPNLVALDFSSADIPNGDRVPPFDTKGRHAMSNRMALTSMGGIAGEMMANGFDVVSEYVSERARDRQTDSVVCAFKVLRCCVRLSPDFPYRPVDTGFSVAP